MDLSPAIERHRKPLLRIVVALFAMIGLAEGGTVERLPSPLYRAVLRVLRPAESAVRRLIVVAAHGLAAKRPPQSAPAGPAAQRKGRRNGHSKVAAFQLFDPRQRFRSIYGNPRRRVARLAPRPEPRIHVIDAGFDPRVPLFLRSAALAPAPPPPLPSPPDGTVSAVRLSRRLTAIRSALDDLPRQARRYARWQAKPADSRRPQLASALRRGAPPGHRDKPVHKVDEILLECDWLARQASRPDTS